MFLDKKNTSNHHSKYLILSKTLKTYNIGYNVQHFKSYPVAKILVVIIHSFVFSSSQKYLYPKISAKCTNDWWNSEKRFHSNPILRGKMIFRLIDLPWFLIKILLNRFTVLKETFSNGGQIPNAFFRIFSLKAGSKF